MRPYGTRNQPRAAPPPRRGYDLNNDRDVDCLRREILALQGNHTVDHPSRILFINKVPPTTDPEAIVHAFAEFGQVKSVYTKTLPNGFVYVFYYDIRNARRAFDEAKRRPFFDVFLHVRYAIARDSPDDFEQNQGTMVIFNLDTATTNDSLREVFGRYGDVKEVRETANKTFHRFVEFQDLRDAQRARDELNNTVLFGRKIKIEPSRPGGARQERLSSVTQSIGLPADMPALPPPEDVVAMLDAFLILNRENDVQRVIEGKLPKFTTVGQELCSSYLSAEVEGTPHLRHERSPSPKPDCFPDNDASKAVVVISNIPLTFPTADLLSRIQTHTSCFYDQLLVVRQPHALTYRVIVQVTNSISVHALYKDLNNHILDSDQDETCVVHVSAVTAGEFTAALFKLIE